MRRTVLLCDWCPKGRVAFGTSHVEIRGLGLKRSSLDFCPPHLKKFVRLLGIGGKADNVEDRETDTEPRELSATAPEEVNRALLRLLSKSRGGTLRVADIVKKFDVGSKHQRLTAANRLAAHKLITMAGTTNDRRYTITAKGRAAAKKIVKLAPIPPRAVKAEVRDGLIAALQKAPPWVSFPELLRRNKPPGTEGAQKVAMLALRHDGVVVMQGTKGRARYQLAKRLSTTQRKTAQLPVKRAGRLNGRRVVTRPRAVAATQASGSATASASPSHQPAGSAGT